jgi:hypothetical protein
MLRKKPASNRLATARDGKLDAAFATIVKDHIGGHWYRVIRSSPGGATSSF